MQQPTLQDLADELGVARSTVSRALRDDPQISMATRERVQRRAATVGYHPNAAARALNRRASGVLGLVLPRTAPFVFANPYFAELFEGVASAAERAGYPILVSSSPTPDYPRWLREQRVDALIGLGDALSTTQLSDLEALVAQGAQVALIGETRSDTSLRVITCDERPGIEAQAAAAAALGHRRAALIAGPRGARYADRRARNWTRALERAGISVVAQLHGDDTHQGGASAAEALLRDAAATLWCCGNDHMAFGASRALQAHGLRSPEDVSLVGFDDVRAAALVGLASVAQPIRALGEHAVEIVVAGLQRREAPAARFRTSFAARPSLGPAPERAHPRGGP